jgi:predicted dehydrogenase
VKEYSRYEDLVSDSSVDWVVIGSWNCYHAEHAIAALEAGRDVFCEKPLALSTDQCLKIRDAWRSSGRKFTIGFTLRYSPHYRRIKEIIASGTIGDIISMEFNETLNFNHGGYIHADWRRKTEWAGSYLLEKCCHDLDVANWMTDSIVKRAASFGGCNFFTEANAHHVERVGTSADGKVAFQSWRRDDGENGQVKTPFTDDKDIVDNQVVILEFANGIRATFHTNCSAAIPERRMYICGTEGTIRSDVLSGSIEVRRIGFDTPVEDHSTGASGGHGDGDGVLAESIVHSMFDDASPITSLEHGLHAALSAFGVDQAMEGGTVFEYDELWKRAGISAQ